MICERMRHEDWRDIVWRLMKKKFVVSQGDESAYFFEKQGKNMDKDRPIDRPRLVSAAY